jgi:hypothetical protein
MVVILRGACAEVVSPKRSHLHYEGKCLFAEKDIAISILLTRLNSYWFFFL